MKWMIAVVLALLVGAVAASDFGVSKRHARITNAPAVGAVISVPAVEWRVLDADGLRSTYRQLTGKHIPAKVELKGFMAYDHGRSINIIYTLPPARIDDDVTRTIGHEMLHVALDEYH